MLNRSWAAALCCLLFGLTAAPAFADCKVGTIAELPVTMSDMQPLVPVKVNGDPVMLVADSGASTASCPRRPWPNRTCHTRVCRSASGSKASAAWRIPT